MNATFKVHIAGHVCELTEKQLDKLNELLKNIPVGGDIKYNPSEAINPTKRITLIKLSYATVHTKIIEL